MKPYENRFKVGEQVRVTERQQLEVEGVSFYHGGDVLYQLKGVPDLWHEICLAPAH